MPIIGTLLIIFKAWMLVDAIQRCSGRCGNNYWFLICWIPFGDWAYFFAVKIHDPEISRYWSKWAVRAPKLDDIRYQAQHSPSVLNRMTLVRALIDHQNYSEADAVIGDLLRLDENDRETQFLAGICKSRAGDNAAAIPIFESLVQKDLSAFDYRAAAALSEIYWAEGRKDDSVELLKKVFKRSQRLSHQVELAKCLFHLDRKEEAKTVLESGMHDYKHSPRFVKRQYRTAAKEAQSMLRAIP